MATFFSRKNFDFYRMKIRENERKRSISFTFKLAERNFLERD